MNEIQKNLVDIAKLALGQEDIFCEIEITDWNLLFQAIKDQGLATILFPVIEKLPEEKRPQPELFQIWRKNIQNSVFKRLWYVQEVSRILEQFEKAELHVIVLKGLAIARFWEKPEYRTMSDLDIFIERELIEKTRNVLETMGFVYEGDGNDLLHYEYIKPNSVPVELHTTLVHSGFLGKRYLEDWNKHIWYATKQIETEGIKFRTLAVEDELINQVIHFGTHLVYTGAKLKHLLDIAIIIKSASDIDWKYIEKILRITGFFPFAELIFATCLYLFQVEIPKQMTSISKSQTEQFIDDFLDHFSIVRGIEDCKGWLTVVCRFPSFYRKPALYPFACAVEYLSQIKINGLDFKSIFKNANNNLKKMKKKVNILREYGLIVPPKN